MPYTLAEAATATGTNKTTILRAIKSGKISGAKDEHGEWHIEPAELHRVYPAIEARSAAGSGAAQQYAVPSTGDAAEAHGRAALAEQRLSDLKAALADMRDQRDKWQAQAERLVLAAPLTTPAPATRPWWRRLGSAA